MERDEQPYAQPRGDKRYKEHCRTSLHSIEGAVADNETSHWEAILVPQNSCNTSSLHSRLLQGPSG